MTRLFSIPGQIVLALLLAAGGVTILVGLIIAWVWYITTPDVGGD